MIKMKSKIRMRKKVLSLFVISLILVSLISIQASKDEYKIEDASTWPEDLDRLRGTTGDEKNTVWDESSDFVKDYVLNKVPNELRDRRRTSSKSPDYTDSSNLKLTGFKHENLKWGVGYSIGDGNVEINLDSIPPGVEEVEYVFESDGRSRFIYKYKDGGKVVLEGEGKISKDNIYSTKTEGFDNKVKKDVTLTPGKGTITIGKGTVKIEGDAKIQIGGNSYTVFDESKSGIIDDKGSYLEVQNVIAETPKFEIATSVDQKTTLVFQKGDYSDFNSYVQIYDDPENEKRTIFQVTDKTGDIIVSAKAENEGKGYEVILTGEDDFIRNGKWTFLNRVPNNDDTTFRIVGNKVFTNRVAKDGSVDVEIFYDKDKAIEQRVAAAEKEKARIAVLDTKKRKEDLRINPKFLRTSNAYQKSRQGAETVRLEAGFNRGIFKELPDGLSKTGLAKELYKDTKVKITTRLYAWGNIAKGQHGGEPYIIGKDLRDTFLGGKSKTNPSGGSVVRQNNYLKSNTISVPEGMNPGPFDAAERRALDQIFSNAYKNKDGSWKSYPPGSTIELFAGDKPRMEIRVNNGKIYRDPDNWQTDADMARVLREAKLSKPIVIQITDPKQIAAFNKNVYYGLVIPDAAFKKQTKYDTPAERLLEKYYPNRENCDDLTCF